ncbi:MAG: cell wall-active antibiotics response protein [Defluviitaleaceae bacterium]|nr:cell wall-active antibiotics response protein [Defluviitaleaceae bacterium]
MGKSNVKKIMWGLFFVGAAALILVNAYFEFFAFWQLLALIALVPTVIASVVYRNFSGIFLPLALLLVVFSEPLGIPISPLPIIAAGVLLTIAFSIIFPGKWKKIVTGGFDIGGVSGEDTSCTVNFGGTTKYFKGENIKHASIECNFGGVDIYMTDVTLDPGGAMLNVSLNFGGIELYVPRDWNIVNSVSVSAGAIDEEGRCTAGDGAPTLTIVGNVAFGGMDIHYV